MKYLKEEQRIIVGKKVKIKICETPKDGRFLAKALPLKTIIISKNLKNYLGKRSYWHVLFHERAHLESINLVRFLPYFMMVLLFFLNFQELVSSILDFKWPIVFLIKIVVLILIEPFFIWGSEILADRFAVKNSKKSDYEATLIRVYDDPRYLGNRSWFYRNIYHPPKKIRFWFIKRF